MKYAVLDLETTTSNNGNPFDTTNCIKVIGLLGPWGVSVYDCFYSGKPTGDIFREIQTKLDSVDFIIGFNPKFDILHLRRCGIRINRPIWDTQYTEFALGAQLDPKISLESACEARGLGKKVQIDWTKETTLEELTERVSSDVVLTEKLFLAQKKDLEDKPQLKRLCWFGSQDILVTTEMEWNGLKYDLEQSKTLGDKLVEAISDLDRRLFVLRPYSFLNFGSHEHISAILYGGTVKYKERGIVTKKLKSGKESIREKWFEKEFYFDRIVEPLEGSKLEKEGFFSTDEKSLRGLAAVGEAKEIIAILLERAKLSKKVGTYFHGIPKLYDEMHWNDSTLHGQLIHVRAITGRLASKNPNQQNLDEQVRKCIITRFPKH